MSTKDYGPRLVINVQTGEQTLIELTPEEVMQRDADIAEAVQEQYDVAILEQTRQQRHAELRAALNNGSLSQFEQYLVREVLDE